MIDTDAVAWIDAHVERTGEVEEVRVRPWASVLRAPTRSGPVWMKLAGEGTAFEVPLYRVLARAVPERVLTPIAVDVERAWLLLPDGGSSLGERDAGLDALVDALVEYGRLQRELEPAVEEMLALGVPDMRPQVMPARFHEALAAAGGNADVAAMEPEVIGWCERLAASPLAPSLDHNDLHPWNMLEGPRYYDWGDSVIAHPFAAMLVPLGYLQYRFGDERGGARPRRLPRRVRRPRLARRARRDARARVPGGQDRPHADLGSSDPDRARARRGDRPRLGNRAGRDARAAAPARLPRLISHPQPPQRGSDPVEVG